MACNVLLVAFIITLASVDGLPIGGCTGGYNNGETVERSRYWYVCQNGELEPKGCLDDSRNRLNIGESYKSTGFVIECVLDDRRDLIFKYKGCVSEDNKEHAIDDTWQDSNYWYACVKVIDKVRQDIKGCVDNAKRYNIGESMCKTDLTYVCSSDANNNIGWNIYPNLAYNGKYEPDMDHVHVKNP